MRWRGSNYLVQKTMLKLNKTALATLCAASLLAGCANTAYQRPALVMPVQWPSLPAAQQNQANTTALTHTSADPWWQTLGDAQLASLIDLALAKNNNLAAAAFKVRNAQLQAGNAMGKRLPTLSGNLTENASRSLETGSSPIARSYGGNLGISWEVDLWNKLGAQQRAADWEASATAQDREATAQALIGTVAKTYWQLATVDQRLALQQSSLQDAAKTLQLVQVQHQAGAASGLELAQATQSHANQLAAATTLEQQRTELRNALAILFDAPPGQLPDAAQHPRLPDMAALPAIAAGLPAEILGRRPDLRAAEQRLQATLAQADVARTSFYPTLGLTGSVGSSSAVLSQALKHPLGALGLNLALPLLNLGEMQRTTAIAQNTYEQAAINFRQTLYQALAEVDNALSARIRIQQQEGQLQVALKQSQQVKTRSEARYRAGAAPLKHWLDAQESHRNAQRSLLDAQLARLNNLVTLYQALGGSAVLPQGSTQAAPPA